MWLVGGLIGLLLGAAAGHSLWLLGALIGAVAGTLIERQRARQSQADHLLAAWLGQLEHEIAKLRSEI